MKKMKKNYSNEVANAQYHAEGYALSPTLTAFMDARRAEYLTAMMAYANERRRAMENVGY